MFNFSRILWSLGPLRTGSLFIIGLLMLSCGTEKTAETGSDARPNIVYILADDMGYGDISALNSNSAIPTKNMDRMVTEGMYFSDAHSNSSVCTPTRYGVLTGRYAWRSRLKTGVLWGYDPPLIEKERPTVASFMRNQGYQTACIGKWHLGLGWQPKDTTNPIAKYEWTKVFHRGDNSNVDFSQKVEGPNDIGFDYSYIIPASLDMTPYLYLENGSAVELPTAYTEGKDQETHGRGVFWRSGEVSPNFVFEEVLDELTSKAVDFISDAQHSKDPFFLYFPLTAPHTPWLPDEQSSGKSGAGTYGDFVYDVDKTVGEVLRILEETGQLENTLVIVTSDNGAHWTPGDKEEYEHRANYHFRGQKADIYEGGHHVPFLAMWPAKIAPGTSSDQLMCTTDLMATMAGLLGTDLPEGAGEDSYDLSQAFVDPSSLDAHVRDHIIHHSLHGIFSVRVDEWKLTEKLGSGGFSKPQEVESEEFVGSLYNIYEDLAEENNLYNVEEEVREALLKKLDEVRN